MNITNIAVSGYGGLEKASFAIKPIQLITGPNGSGKTALLDAVALGLIGYCPWLGNKPAFTRGRMSGGAASIKLDTDCGASSIMFPKTGSPIVKRDPGIPEIDPMVIDIAKFFAMTGPQKIRFLLGVSTVSVPTESDVRKVMWESTVHQHGLSVDDWSKMVDPMFAKVKGDRSTLEWLTELTVAATEMKQIGAGLPSLRETLQKMEVEAVAKDSLPPVDVSVDLEKARHAMSQVSAKMSEKRGYMNALNSQLRALVETENRCNKMMVDIPDKKCPTCGGVLRGETRADSVKKMNEVAARNAVEASAKVRQQIQEIQVEIDNLAKEEGVENMKVSALRARQDQYLGYRAKLNQMDELRLKIAEVEDGVAVFSPIPLWISRYQASLLDGNMQHVCAVASRILSKRFEASLVIKEGKFYMVNSDGAEISLECASGGQRLLATLGIQVALMQASKFKIVLVDELGTADDDSLMSVIEVVKELVAEKMVDQFIGAGPNLEFIDDVAVISLGGEE